MDNSQQLQRTVVKDIVAFCEDSSIKETKLNGVTREYYNYQNNQIRSVKNDSNEMIVYDNSIPQP